MTNEDLAGADLPAADLPRRPVPSPGDVLTHPVEGGLPHAGAADQTVGQALAEDELQAPVTGDEDVDALIAQLVAHAAVPLEEQLPILEAVHRTLQDRLADVEG